MAIFNTNEFLRKTFSKTIFGTAALRPEAVCVVVDRNENFMDDYEDCEEE